MEILKDDPQTKGKDGVYQIRVKSELKSVYCDMTTEGGGWTVSTLKHFLGNWTRNTLNHYGEGQGVSTLTHYCS
jgi:hypothetical protein